ncbi:hypothetical protein FHW20_004444 [Ochrobactrum intermedium]|uniref:Uncharacterized protein n=1 Tax=Brucella intermedia TaxID=94625 RepID=A0ABR6AVG5_9HYPH|nr:hypothetical protein [Brucella intermedia]
MISAPLERLLNAGHNAVGAGPRSIEGGKGVESLVQGSVPEAILHETAGFISGLMQL